MRKAYFLCGDVLCDIWGEDVVEKSFHIGHKSTAFLLYGFFHGYEEYSFAKSFGHKTHKEKVSHQSEFVCVSEDLEQLKKLSRIADKAMMVSCHYDAFGDFLDYLDLWMTYHNPDSQILLLCYGF